MIREFFNVRVAVVFIVLWALIALGMHVWLHMTPAKHKRWLHKSKIPAFSALWASAVCVVLVVVLSFL